METRYEEEGLKERTREIEKSIIKRFRKEIWRPFVKALNEYEMIQEGDQIAVCISGGKDSMLMAKCFQELKVHNKFDFEVKFLVMDPGYSPENRKVIEDNAKKLNIPITIFESDIFESVFNVEKSPCYLCARMRRGHLYHFAKDMGCNKIALGHHHNDVLKRSCCILIPLHNCKGNPGAFWRKGNKGIFLWCRLHQRCQTQKYGPEYLIFWHFLRSHGGCPDCIPGP